MEYLNKAYDLIDKINSYGYEAYIIGGAVRDYLLKKEINDIDITTNMSIEDLKKHFSYIDNGSSYLSITIDYCGYNYEITTYRCDSTYDDYRHPIATPAATLKEDVIRRDFTINAIAMNRNEIIDYCEGKKDLENKIIKAIGNPLARFNEDALRILRACNFASKLDFDIETNTLKAIIACKRNLIYLSNERIIDYIFKIIYQINTKGLEYINNYDLFEYIPIYKKAINTFNSTLTIDENYLLYYYKYNEELPTMPKSAKKYISTINQLIKEGFTLYNIFIHKAEILMFKNLIKALNYDIDDIIFKLNNLKINSIKELALSQAKIASMFSGKNIATSIKRVIEEILEGRINNEEKEIIHYLEGIR